MPVVHHWRQAGQPAEVASQAIAHINGDRLVVLPTEAGPMIATKWGDNPPARFASSTQYWAAADSSAIASAFPDVTTHEEWWANRVWPAGVVWKRDDSSHLLWIPNHLMSATVLSQTGPLLLTPVSESQLADDDIAMVIADDQPTGQLTVVRLADREWSVLQPGMVSENWICQRLSRQILFICTGNTCRSPMAEALFKKELALRLNCGENELLQRGYWIRSAGTSASVNDGPTPEAVDVLLEWNVDHREHRSTPAGAELIASADDIIGMTRNHLLTVLSRYPVIRGNLRLLCGVDGDLDDPIGSGPSVYRACAETIRRHVNRLITEMGLT